MIANDLPTHAWLDGQVVPWADCRIHVRSQGAFWGANVFEGIRGYWLPSQERLSFFRLDEHLKRLRDSARCLRMQVPVSDAELAAAMHGLAEANHAHAHVHVVIGLAYGLGPRAESLGHIDAVHVHVTMIELPRSPRFIDGIAVGTSSWRRISDESMPPRIKTGANYHNSRLAHQEAVHAGYDTALILNGRGTVAEGPGACVAAVIGDTVVSPPSTAGALPGITLRAVETLARAQGRRFEQRELDRSELYLADEAMLCGTLVEIQPITSVDRIPVGDGTPGPVVRALQRDFDRLVGASGA